LTSSCVRGTGDVEGETEGVGDAESVTEGVGDVEGMTEGVGGTEGVTEGTPDGVVGRNVIDGVGASDRPGEELDQGD
jgi:hypothetical protein